MHAEWMLAEGDHQELNFIGESGYNLWLSRTRGRETTRPKMCSRRWRDTWAKFHQISLSSSRCQATGA